MVFALQKMTQACCGSLVPWGVKTESWYVRFLQVVQKESEIHSSFTCKAEYSGSERTSKKEGSLILIHASSLGKGSFYYIVWWCVPKWIDIVQIASHVLCSNKKGLNLLPSKTVMEEHQCYREKATTECLV